MTIHELEKRTGLPRASIRFYEKEGLIAPKRLANGYRDYSEEDALAVEKIALLRRLDLPLEDIRRVQSGEVPLGIALEKQDEALVARQKETEQALRISRAIRNEGASYSTLQPEKYKAQLPPPRQIVLPREPKHYATKHPWRRLLARELDMALLTLPGIFLLAWLVAGFKVWLWAILLALIVCAASMLLLEPLLLCTVGTTPGKWLMGLRLRYSYYDHTDKPTFGQALFRTLHVWFQGCGMGIGLFALIGFVCSYLRANRGEDQPWDFEWEYTADETVSGTAVCLLLAGLLAANFGQEKAMDLMEHRVSVLVERQLEDPTREDFINSVNLIFASHWELAEYRDIAIAPDGKLTGREALTQYTLTITAEDGAFQSALLTGPDNELTSALTNGLFLGVLEALDAGSGLKNTVRAYSNGDYSRVGDWCMEYTVQNGVATVTIQKTDEPIGYS